ncbi:MAG: cache domain-containing protein, partial [Steroidobacteraceae bacterium]
MNSFRNRLLVLIIGLIAVTQTVTLVAVLESTRRSVETRAAEQLTAGTSYALQLVKFRASQLASGVAVLAADFGFREAVSLLDPPTILSAASNQSRRIDADLLFLVDTQGKLIAATERMDQGFVASLDDLIDRAQMSPDLPHFGLQSGRLYQFFAAPVRAPDTIAWVVMGFAVNDALARKIGDLVGVDVSFIAIDGMVARNVASTLGHNVRDLMSALPEPGNANTASGKLMLGQEEFLIHVVDLEPDNHAVRL